MSYKSNYRNDNSLKDLYLNEYNSQVLNNNSLNTSYHFFANNINNILKRIEAITNSEEYDEIRQELVKLQQEFQNSVNYNRQLEHLLEHDYLLPVANRRAFITCLSDYLTSAERKDACLIFIDMDKFKRINDNFSHAAGDAALIHCTNILKSNIRNSDYIGRLGGDELGIIMKNIPYDEAVRRAKNMAENIKQQPLNWHGRKIKLSLSYGVVQLNKFEQALQAIKTADELMYLAKNKAYTNK